MDILIPPQLEDLIRRQVATGRYRDAAHVVREALRLLEARDVQFDPLRSALIEGEQSGVSTPLDIEAFLASRRTSSAW